MKNRKMSILIGLAALLVVVMSAGGVTAQEPTALNLGYSAWVGYGPWFIAQDQGYFTEHNLNVTLTDVENPSDRFAALASGHLDGLMTTEDTMSQYCNAETPFKAFLGLDTSSGGDGIVANGITDVAGLKGKTIGVRLGSVSQFFLEYVLQQNGMTDADVTLVDMGQGDVPAALAANRIDAGVTWEPNLSKATDNGANRVIDSTATPGLIVDIMLLNQSVIDAHPEVPDALVQSWYESIEYLKANPDDGATIMADGLPSYYETAADVNADMSGVTLYDKTDNEQFFSGTDIGSATGTLQFALDFYTQIGRITDPCKPEDMLDAKYVLPNGPVPLMTAEPNATAEATAAG
jgi:NitT/TauT family transport system substrate-binding protein